MKVILTAATVAGALAAAAAFGQTPKLTTGGAASAPAPRDPKVFPASAALPTPTPPDQIKPPTIALPNDPIEPFLLTRGAGPFLVMARTFRGPEADRYALALCKELRQEYGLPAWILRSRDFPMRSNIRQVPPTADRGIPKPELAFPEKVRTYDEAMVLVGNEKTLADQEKLWKKVKLLKPRCLEEIPSPFHWRKGLSTALRTTNPFVPAQDLYAGKKDELVHRMNQGPHSIYQCPGRYTLEIAKFSGRETMRVDEARTASLDILKKSPLATAAEDAERLASSLAKIPEIMKTGQPVYVYHDRTSSRVLMGAFASPTDPAAIQLRDYLLKNYVAMMDLKDPKSGKPVRSRGLDVMIAPAEYLTDLDDPTTPIRPQGPAKGMQAAK